MKSVSEFKDFADAVAFQNNLKGERDTLEAERAKLLSELAFDNRNKVSVASAVDQAAAILAGEHLPANEAEIQAARRTRELEIRQRLGVLNRALLVTPERIERQRSLAAGARRQELDREFAKVSKDYQEAVRLLKAAIAAEDALIAGMIEGGFGGREPEITTAFWLNRELLKIN